MTGVARIELLTAAQPMGQRLAAYERKAASGDIHYRDGVFSIERTAERVKRAMQ